VLIKPDTPWPPPGPDAMRTRWASWSAWWGGDPKTLACDTLPTSPAGYWTRRAVADEAERSLHLPLAGDIARTSAELVFGDTPAMQWTDDMPATDTSDPGTAPADPVGDEWERISQEMGWSNSLLEAGEVAAALGGVYLRPQWDSALTDRPLLTIVRPDEALPTFRYGILTAVTFVTELGSVNGFVLRWLEHHEPGQIRHELWRGTNANIGIQTPLAEHQATAPLAALLDERGVIDTTGIRPDGGLLVEYVPNDLPQPLDRLPYGRSDLQGQESLLDSLDEVYASLMRDVELAAARAIVPAEFLDGVLPEQPGRRRLFGSRQPRTPARRFDPTRRYFTALPGMAPDSDGKQTGITTVQPEIRVTEHVEAALHLVEQIVSRAGYAPQTMGMHVEGQLSGTAMRRREQRSYRTRDRKRRYFRPALERLAETLMLINAVVFDGPVPVGRPALEWRAVEQADPKEAAETVEILRRAQAMSVYQAVKTAHPEWDEPQVEDEVGRVEAEQAVLAAPEPTGYEPPPGTDPDDEPPVDGEE